MSQLYSSSVTVGRFLILCACCAICFSLGTLGSQASAQTSKPIGGGNPPPPPVDVAPNIPDRAGGVTLSDFQPLVSLIQNTINTELWSEAGGSGSIVPYAQGVFADAGGTLKFEPANKAKVSDKALADFVDNSPIAKAVKARPVELGDARQATELRFISLPRLEAALANHIKERKALPAEVLTLAGLQRIQYVIVVPATDEQPGDLILAGPAGDWRTEADGMIVSVDHQQPIVRIDDLLTLWRRPDPNEPFGVTINPTEAGLAAMQDHLAATNGKAVKRAKRDAWVEGIRSSIGKQSVEFFSLKPDSHVAKALLTADYHMKCIGMGIADPVDGMKSYLDTVKLGPNGEVPPMSVLRWWFAMNYQPVAVSENNQVFELQGVGAKVLSENQLMAAQGKRIRTGKSEALNRQFAASFSKQFKKITEKYPIYDELRNIFDLSLTLALIDKQSLLVRSGWQPGLLLDPVALQLPKIQVASEVDTIANYRVIDKKVIVAGVSGGVWVDSNKHYATQPKAIAGSLSEIRPQTVAATSDDQPIVWWWDRP
ncbi:DUF1598 domain-containing protein [Mariniblastus sp.]|nr:DUF1598 domain-containing protein [Mariniblastus sp.]